MPFIPEENKRTSSVRVRLSSDLLERLEALARRYGMPVSTLSAFAIARFVQNEEMSRMVVMDTARKQAESMDDERMERIFGPMLEGMLTAAQRGQFSDLLDKMGGEDEGATKT